MASSERGCGVNGRGKKRVLGFGIINIGGAFLTFQSCTL